MSLRLPVALDVGVQVGGAEPEPFTDPVGRDLASDHPVDGVPRDREPIRDLVDAQEPRRPSRVVLWVFMGHDDTEANSRSSVRGFSESPAEEVFRRRIREEREGREWTQQHLADLMTEAGAPMRHDAISKIESGERGIYFGEAVLFAGVFKVPFVRLASPLEGEEVVVRVDGHRPPLQPIELRNWFVFGHWWTPAAQSAQKMIELAYAALDVNRSPADKVDGPKGRLREILSSISPR